MTTTTKIFIILVSLFAFIFTPMAIQFAARTYKWKDAAEANDATAKAALASERSTKAIADSEIAHYKALRDEAQKRLLASQQQMADVQRKLDTLQQERDQLARSRDMLETQTGVLTAEVAVKSKHNSELTEIKEKALARERELQTTNTWLTDQLQLKRAEADELKQQLNHKVQEIVAFRDENEQLRKNLGMGKAAEIATATPASSVEPMSPPARSPIEGKVTQISGNRASIDVGSASGVKEGMVMVVTRNNFKEYVGDIRITKDVTPNEAVGEFRANKDKALRVGDIIEDEASFNKR